jgi:branched-chain amino acid transport system ATP-binding protein
VKELFAAIGSIRETGMGVLMVEQNARESLRIADRGYVSANGRVTGSGSAFDLQSDDSVRRAYLGGVT